MGVYNDILITVENQDDRINACYNFLDSFDDISVELGTETSGEHEYSGVNFSINNSPISGFVGWKTTEYGQSRRMYVNVKNGDTVLTSAESGAMQLNNVSISVYDDSDCVFILFSSLASLEFIVVNANNSKKLVGYKNNTSSFTDISLLTFEEVNDLTRTQLAYTNMFPYSANSGTLDFLAQAYFVNNGVRRYTTTILKECSTVTVLSTVSLPPPLNNHLAIGAHCIVPLDDEGGNT